MDFDDRALLFFILLSSCFLLEINWFKCPIFLLLGIESIALSFLASYKSFVPLYGPLLCGP